jgi:hypothetical protein
MSLQFIFKAPPGVEHVNDGAIGLDNPKEPTTPEVVELGRHR